jgi:hypothetical protein
MIVIFGSNKKSPLFEFGVEYSAGESLSTDTDSFKYTVTLKLIEYKSGINDTWRLGLVRNDATHKVGVSSVQVLHQLVQRFL